MVLVYFPVIFRILKVKLVRFLQMKMLSIKCLLSSPASSWVVGGLGIRWNPVRPRRQDYYDPFQIHYGTLASRRSRHGAARLRFSFRPEHVWKNPTETPWYLCKRIYHLVMTNSSPWKDPPFLRTVNHLFLWAIFHGYVK